MKAVLIHGKNYHVVGIYEESKSCPIFTQVDWEGGYATPWGWDSTGQLMCHGKLAERYTTTEASVPQWANKKKIKEDKSSMTKKGGPITKEEQLGKKPKAEVKHPLAKQAVVKPAKVAKPVKPKTDKKEKAVAEPFLLVVRAKGATAVKTLHEGSYSSCVKAGLELAGCKTKVKSRGWITGADGNEYQMTRK